MPLPKGSQLRTIEEHSSPEEIARVRTLLACHRSTITDAVPEEFKPLIVGEWAAAFSRLPPLSKAFPPEIRAEHTQLQSSAWALRKFLEPGGSSHTGVNDDLMQQIRAARLLPTAHPLTHIPRHQVIVRETLSDLILEYLRLSGPEKLNKFLSFGEKIFELAIIDKNSLGVDQCELVDPFKGFQTLSSGVVRMDPDVLEHFAFCHHASWRQARRIGQELGVALNAQGLKGFVPEERKEDAPYLRGRDTALLKRDAINVLCLSIAYNFFPHIKQNLLAAAAIPTS